MVIEIRPEIVGRLEPMAQERKLSVGQLIERIVEGYLSYSSDDASAWVAATRQSLANVWPVEDFSDWNPPHAS